MPSASHQAFSRIHMRSVPTTTSPLLHPRSMTQLSMPSLPSLQLSVEYRWTNSSWSKSEVKSRFLLRRFAHSGSLHARSCREMVPADHADVVEGRDVRLAGDSSVG